jgi:hypothetical protein
MIFELFVIIYNTHLSTPFLSKLIPPSDLQPVDAPDLQSIGCVVRAMKFYSFYSRFPHPHALRFRVWMFRMHGPQWNNTRIILTDVRYPAIDASYLVKTGAN